jgi:hypothetical protein
MRIQFNAIEEYTSPLNLRKFSFHVVNTISDSQYICLHRYSSHFYTIGRSVTGGMVHDVVTLKITIQLREFRLLPASC